MQLQRLVIETKPEELVIRVLYRSEDGPNPGTKARRREVEALAREGLRQALASLQGDAELVGCSGFSQREDVILAVASSDAQNTVGTVKPRPKGRIMQGQTNVRGKAKGER
jgi:hypothetical protein